MFVKVFKDDITTVKQGIIAHGVNCQGVMGSGVAKAIKEKWPLAYTEYRKTYEAHKDVGDLLGRVNVVQVDNGIVVANCFTQEFYGRDGKRYASLKAIEESLDRIMRYAYNNAQPFHMVKIGCGLGGCDWDTEVLPITAEMSTKHTVPVYVYEI